MNYDLRRTPGPKMLQIDYLFLDLHSCTRCRGTDQNLDEAIETLRRPLAAAGVEVSQRKVLVESREQAEQERLVTSPTIRINGRDIATVEQTPCDACSDLCGCEEGTLCRVWNYRGQSYSVAPTGLLIEAIVDAAFSTDSVSSRSEIPQVFELPENLKRFFASKPSVQPDSGDERRSPCCASGGCECDGVCDCSELESASCGCHS